MRILLDECIDRRFAVELTEHDVKTVPQMGWAGVKNGSLMKLAEGALTYSSLWTATWPFNRTFQITISPWSCFDS